MTPQMLALTHGAVMKVSSACTPVAAGLTMPFISVRGTPVASKGMAKAKDSSSCTSQFSQTSHLPQHLPHCVWRWPHRYASWTKRPWLSLEAHAPCSYTWPNVGNTGRQGDKLALEVRPGNQHSWNYTVEFNHKLRKPVCSKCCSTAGSWVQP